MSRAKRHILIALVLSALWILAPEQVFADNCSSLNDCYYTLRAALAAAVGLGIFAAFMTIGLDAGPLAGKLRKRWKNGNGAGAGETAGESLEGGSQVEAKPADVWERSLGIVSLEGLLPRQMGQQARPLRTSSTQGTSPSPSAEEAPPGMQQAKRSSPPPAEASQQGQPPDATASELQMRQAGQDVDLSGDMEQAKVETSHSGTEEGRAASRRTPDRAQSEIETGQLSGRRGDEGSGVAREQTSAVADTGDVVDRAQEVTEAFDDPERMAQSSKQIDASSQSSATEPASLQAEAPPDDLARHEPGQQSARPVDTGPGETGQQSAKPAQPDMFSEAGEVMHPASNQGSPPDLVQDEAATAAGNIEPTIFAPLGQEHVQLVGNLLRSYGELARMPGVRGLMQQVATHGIWAAHGVAAHLQVARKLQAQAVVSELRVEQLAQGADIVLDDGPVIEVKNYYWAGPFFQNEENVTEATRRLVRQVEILRRRHPGRDLQVAFNDLAGIPSQMRTVLQSIGVALLQTDSVGPGPDDIAGVALSRRLHEMTVDDYGRALLRAGWSDTSPAVGMRLRAAFRRDPASAWLALAHIAFDSESIYETNELGESYAAHIKQLGLHSGGALRPERVSDEIDEETRVVAFENSGRRYVRRISAGSDYFDAAVLEMVNEAIGEQNESRRFVHLPAPDQMLYLLFATPEIVRRLVAADLIPPPASSFYQA